VLPLPEHAAPVWEDSTGFVPALDKLVRDKDLGALAALRQSLQVPTGIAPDARPYVEPLLPPKASRRVRGIYFLVAALCALHRDQTKGVSFGQAMRRIHLALGDPKDPSMGTAASERFEQLLAAHPEDVGDLVSAALPLVYEHGALDWERLLHDLIFWGRRDRLIQRTWARDFYESAPSLPPSPPEVP
jgi:CRISPR type I-E-associated protein CasB/Cse2